MSGSNIKYKGREGNKRHNNHISLINSTYYTIINHTYPLLYNTSICQVITSNIKVEKEIKGINKL